MSDGITDRLDYLDRQFRIWTCGAVLAAAGGVIAVYFFAAGGIEDGLATVALLAGAGLSGVAIYATIRAVGALKRCKDCARVAAVLEALCRERYPAAIGKHLRELRAAAVEPNLARLIDARRPAIERQLEAAEERVARERRQERLEAAFRAMREHVIARIAHARKYHPRIAARDAAIGMLARVNARRMQLKADVDEILRGASWWQKLTYDYPDYHAMDREIEKLEAKVDRFLRENARAIEAAEVNFAEAEVHALARLACSATVATDAIPDVRHVPCDEDALARQALLLSALSVPVSAWNDLARTGEVYDALRSVNGAYAGMSDFEIWFQCLTMRPERLAGLMSLTKGALFEEHVAGRTGGVLHAQFNTPDTDIVIDGVAYQIKATDSASYIATVEADIPVIATSEVAETTRAIDGGMSNAELDSATALALGGPVVDNPDTAMDAALTGLGGIGILATMRGINHAIDLHRKGMDKDEAIEEGVIVAVEGSLKATVDLAEFGYKAATSRPVRFVGRKLLGAAKRIDGGSGVEEGRAVDAEVPRPSWR